MPSSPPEDTDPLFDDAATFVRDTGVASTAALQSQFYLGHPRASRIMKQLEERKVVGPYVVGEGRKVLGIDTSAEVTLRERIAVEIAAEAWVGGAVVTDQHRDLAARICMIVHAALPPMKTRYEVDSCEQGYNIALNEVDDILGIPE